MMFDKHANLKYKLGHHGSTVGLNKATIKKYIQEKEKNDTVLDKLRVNNPLGIMACSTNTSLKS